MPVIARQLPNSNPTRRTALKVGKTKRDNSHIATDVLRATTISRLDILSVDYEKKYKEIDDALVDSTKTNATKDKAQTDLFLFASHYIMVMNLAIRRGEIPAQDRAYYQLDISSDALPYMLSEETLLQVGENIVDGDAKRVAAGGVPMSNPTAQQVKDRLSNYQTALIKASETTDKLDIKREALDKLNSEADEVILKVWDEVESYFNNESIESKRANSREWGVVFISTGAPTEINLTVLLAGGAPAVNYEVNLLQGKGSHFTDAQGKVNFSTTLNGELTVVVTLQPGTDITFTQIIKVKEGVAFTAVVQLPK